MSNKKDPVSVTFRVDAIYTSEFFWHENYVQKKIDIDPLGMTINHHYASGDHPNEVRVKIGIRFYDQSNDTTIASIVCSTIFQIVNLAEFEHEKGKEIDLPEMFLITIGSISLSHTRALLADRTNGSFVLPVVNPQELFRESIRKSRAEAKGKN